MRTVLVDGCWDPLHYGHLLHLEAAKRMGDFLIVGVTADAFVNKGPNRPVLDDKKRSYFLAALNCVDRVFVCKDSLEALKAWGPDLFVKGKEYEGKIQKEHVNYCYENNITIAFTDTPKYSSTKLLHYYESAGR